MAIVTADSVEHRPTCCFDSSDYKNQLPRTASNHNTTRLVCLACLRVRVLFWKTAYPVT